MTLSGDYAETFEWANTGTGCGGVMTAMGFDLSWSREEGAGGYSVLMSIRGLMPGQTGAATGDMTIGGSALVGTIYSHANDGVCAFDITENSVLQDSSIGRSYKMVGSGSCTEPLDAFPGAGNLTVADGFSFTGVYGVIDAP